ncbi:MAG: beta-N-acetylhexosaminidase [Candidatus Hodarchaeota archaeon]
MRKFRIIPQPTKIYYDEGYFIIDENTTISINSEFTTLASYMQKLLNLAIGFNLKVNLSNNKKEINNSISLEIINNNNVLGSEGYILMISNYNIKITAPMVKGIFYGIQTFRQLIPPEIEAFKKEKKICMIPCVKIEDFPRFHWRGFMLDESRFFFGKDVVKKILDMMAYLKLNVFHWHLTDDQGWRLEIKKYPNLTEIGSKRKSIKLKILRGKAKRSSLSCFTYSGYYSQEDIKEIINYAKERYILIVPEIDLPGHVLAALASYPELGCTGGPFEVSTQFLIHKDVLCIGKEKVFEFVQDVLKEVIALFPSNLVHIGGDEVPLDRWKECSYCQKRIKEEKLNSERELQKYFTDRIVKFLKSQGKRSILWNDILYKELDNDVLCQYWFGDLKDIIVHIKKKRNIIMSNMEVLYLYQAYNNISLKNVYEFEPIPSELGKSFHEQINGLEACLWTEVVTDPKLLEYLLYPRLFAVAETGWTLKNNKNYKNFKENLINIEKRLGEFGIKFAHLKDIEKYD